MNLDAWIEKGFRPLRMRTLAGVGLAFLLAGEGVLRFVEHQILSSRRMLAALQEQVEMGAVLLANARDLRDLKKGDVARWREGIRSLTSSHRALFEAGLSLQEEKRQLEKQWEIMTTYIRVDSERQRVTLMRGDDVIEGYAVESAPPVVYGDGTKSWREVQKITSKERFAHPERGQFVEVGGRLEWSPPQVGDSIRSNALGEYVMFTDSPLILHGPPRRGEEHDAYPHACLGLSKAAARALYRRSFIGTKILIKTPPTTASPLAVERSSPLVPSSPVSFP